MFRRIALTLAALGASLSVLVSPVLGAETFTVRESGLVINVGYSNVPEGVETLPPGDFYVTYVWASSSIETSVHNGGGGEGACLLHASVTVEADGSYTNEQFIFACGDAQVLTIDRRLAMGRLAATFAIDDCLAWDDATGECTELVNLGEAVIDLTLAGEGSIDRYRSAGSGGLAGAYTYAYHGTGSSRAATASGSITLDGVSLIDDPTWAEASLFVTNTGWVEVLVDG